MAAGDAYYLRAPDYTSVMESVHVYISKLSMFE